MRLFNSLTLASVAVAISLSGCKKDYLDRKPTTQVAFEDVFSTVEGARAAINGIHRIMYEFGGGQHHEFGQPSINLMFDLMGDDIIPAEPGHFNASYSYQGARNGTATAGYSWTFYYRIINNANFIIANIDGVTGSDNEKAEVKAQALFYRAYAYYNLANCYMFTYAYGTADILDGGDIKNAPCVPLYTEPTQVGNARASVTEVYNRITTDLNDAISLFDAAQITRTDKSQIDISVARGLAARVYLVMQDWSRAADYAREARASYGIMTASELVKGFNDASNVEWIWGSIINAEQATIFASTLSFMDRDANGYVAINGPMKVNRYLLDSLPSTDLRRRQFTTRADASQPNHPYTQYEQRKFKLRAPGSWVADYPLMRASEMLLIEAEALAQQNRVAEAATLLEDFVKTRNPEYTAPTASTEDLIIEIWFQRRVELWGEGFRYFDIKRSCAPFARTPIWNNTDARLDRQDANTQVAAGIRTLQRSDVRFLFRIPNSEIVQNSLVVQNP